MLIYSVHAYDAEGGYALDVKIGPGVPENVFYKIAREVADKVFDAPITPFEDDEDEEL